MKTIKENNEKEKQLFDHTKSKISCFQFHQAIFWDKLFPP